MMSQDASCWAERQRESLAKLKSQKVFAADESGCCVRRNPGKADGVQCRQC